MRKSLATCLVLLTLSSVARAADPNDVHYFAGVQAYTDGDYQKAISELKASLAFKPSAKAALYLGNAYLKLSQLEEAKSALRQAVELEPDSPKRAQIEQLIRSIEARQGVKAKITSTPPGATIYIDAEANGAVGTTPVEIPFPLGQHQVIVVLDGYETARVMQTVVAGKPFELDVPLRTVGCDATLTAQPSGARASLDGAAPVPLPATVRVAPGEHKVEFTEEGSEPTTLSLRCDGNRAVELAATLASKPRLKVPNDPNQVVTIDGKVVALTAADVAAGLKVPAGRHTVTITSPNNPPWSRTIDVGPGEEVLVGPGSEGVATAKMAPAVYVGVAGGANLVLRDWKLGSNAFVAQDGSHGAHPGSSGTAGVRVGFRFVPRAAVEGEVAWVGLPSTLSSSTGLSYDLGVTFDVLERSWTPILQGGVGMYQVLSGGLGSDTAFRGHLGTGLRGRLTNALFVRIDARDVVSRGFDGIGANNVEVLAGIELVAWQKRAVAPPPPVTGRN